MFRDRDAKARTVDLLSKAVEHSKDRFARFQNGTAPLPPLLRHPLQAGEVGILESTTVKVRQVVDEANMLADLWLESKAVGGEGRQNFEKLVWIMDVPTSGITDGVKVELDTDNIFRIAGTRRYGSASGGTNTVLVLKLLDEGDWTGIVKDLKK